MKGLNKPRNFERQKELVPREAMFKQAATIVGCGAIGRQVAIMLVGAGIPKLQLIDFDIVDDSNVTTQGYLDEQVGMYKVQALAKTLERIDDLADVELFEEEWNPGHKVHPVVFCCVDNMIARTEMFNAFKAEPILMIDGRMGGEVFRVLSTFMGMGAYEESLFTDEQAHPGRCTQQSSLYAASVPAAIMVHQFTRMLRGMELDCDVKGNLLSAEMRAHGSSLLVPLI